MNLSKAKLLIDLVEKRDDLVSDVKAIDNAEADDVEVTVGYHTIDIEPEDIRGILTNTRAAALRQIEVVDAEIAALGVTIDLPHGVRTDETDDDLREAA